MSGASRRILGQGLFVERQLFDFRCCILRRVDGKISDERLDHRMSQVFRRADVVEMLTRQQVEPGKASFICRKDAQKARSRSSPGADIAGERAEADWEKILKQCQVSRQSAHRFGRSGCLQGQ
jgi:hypothetical protein